MQDTYLSALQSLGAASFKNSVSLSGSSSSSPGMAAPGMAKKVYERCVLLGVKVSNARRAVDFLFVLAPRQFLTLHEQTDDVSRATSSLSKKVKMYTVCLYLHAKHFSKSCQRAVFAVIASNAYITIFSC